MSVLYQWLIFKSNLEDTFDENLEIMADIKASIFMIKAGYNYNSILNTYKKLFKIYANSSNNTFWLKRIKHIEKNIEKMYKTIIKLLKSLLATEKNYLLFRLMKRQNLFLIKFVHFENL